MAEFKIPKDCKYTEEHEWVRLEGELAVIGITAYAADQLGDITFVELPAPEDELETGGEMGVIESVKAAADVYAPLAGKVAEVNEVLEDEPGLINSDPHGQGWLVKLSGFDKSLVDGLMDPAAYEGFLGGL